VIEILAVIDAPKFYCGVVLHDDVVIQTAPRVSYMRGWSRQRVRDHCKKQRWRISIVWQYARGKP